MLHRDVLVLGDETPASAAALRILELSLDAAVAHVTAAVFEMKPSPVWISPEGAAELMNVLTKAREEQYRAAKAAVTAATRNYALPYDIRETSVLETDVGYSFAMQARFAELSAIGLPVSDTHACQQWDVFEATLFDSGRPVLLVPEKAAERRIGQRPLIAWNSSREAARAVGDALGLISDAQACRVVEIAGHSRAVNGEDEAYADMAHHLAKYCKAVDTKLVADEGHDIAGALLDEARYFEADMIILGGYGHSRTREWVLGGVTRDLALRSDIPLFLSH